MSARAGAFRSSAEIIGRSTAMQKLRRAINIAARVPLSMLLTGGTGTGKGIDDLNRQTHGREEPSLESEPDLDTAFDNWTGFSASPEPKVERTSAAVAEVEHQRTRSAPIRVIERLSNIFAAATLPEICTSVHTFLINLGIDGVRVEVSPRFGAEPLTCAGENPASAGIVWKTQEAGPLLLSVGLATNEYEHKDTIRVVMEAAAHRLRAIPGRVSSGRAEVQDFIAADPATQSLLSLVRDLAVLDGVGPRSKNQPLMILGERGTGKELIARACHGWSNRAGKPFVAINVGAIDRNLVVSEIFGYRRGAFTGAQSDRRGYIHAAAGGTLFLDEIDEADERTQGLLKRVIQFGTYQVVGDAEERKADVRIIAATNRVAGDDTSIKEDVRDRFWPIVVPPLRERRGDIRPLAQFFARQYEYELPGPVLDWLETLEWPGNVRQLQNTVERACALCRTPDELTLEFFEKCVSATGGKALYRVASEDYTFFPLEPGETLSQREEKDLRRHIEYALRVSGGNRQHAADMLGRTRQWLGWRMKKLGVRDVPA